MTKRPTPVTWNGVQYPSLAAAARANDIAPSGMRWRLDRGYTCDDDMQATARPVTWNGIEYDSLNQCAEALGISRGLLHYRLSRGMTCDAHVTGHAVTIRTTGDQTREVWVRTAPRHGQPVRRKLTPDERAMVDSERGT